MTGHDLVIVVPLWHRTNNIARCYESAYLATPLARVLFVVSAEDHEVVDYINTAELDHLVMAGAGGGQGDYSRKINAGYQATTEPFIFTGADDITFADDWYTAARREFNICRPSPLGVVGTVDDCNPRTIDGSHSTHSLVARWYADLGGSATAPRSIYHEGYWHEYCDDELVQTALMRDAYVHAFGAHVTHHHPMGYDVPDDETYRRGRARTRESRVMFSRRRRLWMHR